MKKTNNLMSVINIILAIVLIIGTIAGMYFWISRDIQKRQPLPDTPMSEDKVDVSGNFIPYDKSTGKPLDDSQANDMPGAIVMACNAVAMDSSVSYPASDTTSGGKYEPISDIKSIFTLKSNVEPATATDKSIDWSIEWVDPNAGQGSDFPASEHPADELLRIGKKTENSCDFLFRGRIPYQMKIVAKSHSDPSIKSECTVDAVRRISDSSLTIDGTAVNADYHMAVDNNNKKFTVSTTIDTANGSLDDEFTYSIEMSSNPAMLKVWNEGLPGSTDFQNWKFGGFVKNSTYNGTLGTYTVNLGNGIDSNVKFNEANFKEIYMYDFDNPKLIELRSMFTAEVVDPTHYPLSKWVAYKLSFCEEQIEGGRQKYIDALIQMWRQGNGPAGVWSCSTPLVLKLKAVGKYSSYEKKFSCAFNNDTIRRQVSNVTIDQGNVVV